MSFQNDFVDCNIKNKIFYIHVKKSLPSNDTEFDGLMNHIDNFYKACEQSNVRVGMIIDVRNLGLLDMKYYQAFADYFSSKKEMSKKCLIASCIICDNAIITGLVNTFLKFYNSVRPVRLGSSIETGIKFVDSIRLQDSISKN